MRTFSRFLLVALLAATAASCGDVVRNGRAPVFLVIDSMSANAGGATGTGTSFLQSDVQQLLTTPPPCAPATPCPTILDDAGTVVFHLELKDIGSVASPASPSSNNQVTINRYHVAFKRSDGRNTQGVDVPYAFDGAFTVTVPVTGTASAGFELVRHVAKQEAPLVQLVSSPVIITTIAEVTFYGQDLVGNAIQATGTIQVDFGNFADR
jgi:hypothetical protein